MHIHTVTGSRTLAGNTAFIIENDIFVVSLRVLLVRDGNQSMLSRTLPAVTWGVELDESSECEPSVPFQWWGPLWEPWVALYASLCTCIDSLCTDKRTANERCSRCRG